MGSFIPLLAEKPYTDKLAGLAPTAYWPLNELAGTTADNGQGSASYDGTYSNVTLGGTGILPGSKAASFNGTTSYLNLLAAAAAFNGQEGTLAFWLKPSDPNVWGDATNRRLFTIFVNASNFVYLQRHGAVNAMLLGQYVAGGTTKTISSLAAGFRRGWAHVALTWSLANDRLKLYVDGVACGQTQTGLGTWAGVPTLMVVGAGSLTPTSVWSGQLSMLGLWDTELTGDQVLSLSRKTPGLPVVGQRLACHYFGRSGAGVFMPGQNKLLYDYRDLNEDWQLATTTTDEQTVVLLTDPAPTGGPAATLHKGWPAIHPTADWAACQVEIAGNPHSQGTTQPIVGVSNDVWIFQPSTNSNWTNITNYGTGAGVGTLSIAFSLDGNSLYWSEKTAAADASHVHGYWRLVKAAFNPVTGAVDFANRTAYTPFGDGWYEVHGEVAANTVLISHDRGGTRSYTPDMGLYNLTSGLMEWDSNDGVNWQEHGTTSPDGDEYVYSDTSFYGPIDTDAIPLLDYSTLKGEAVYVGANCRERISYFNHPDYPEWSEGEACYALQPGIESGGGRVGVTRHHAGLRYDTDNWHHQFIVHRKV